MTGMTGRHFFTALFGTVLAGGLLCASSLSAAQNEGDTQNEAASPTVSVTPEKEAEDGIGDRQVFSFDSLTRHAHSLASKPWQGQADSLPQWMKELDYDAYRKIRFKSDAAVSIARNMKLQLFHPGFLFRDPVRIALLDEGIVHDIPYDPQSFDFGDMADGDTHKALLGQISAFAGFRLHYPLNFAGIYDEVLAFQGASYFRFLGSGQQYGLSARGLAINTASAKGEEFPRFTAFWIEKNRKDEGAIRIYALLESQSITGAYRFDLMPGNASVIEVTARLFARNGVEKTGIAPLTSMFLYGESRNRPIDDYRPEVHDSDGLLIQNGAGEWLWRPLTNPRRLGVNAFRDNNPRGFGLFQRDADFAHYRDLEAHYHLRPSYWVEPMGDWGPGHVELVEIPSPDETNDNIVAYWVPGSAFSAGERRDFSYRLVALDPGLSPHELGRATLSLETKAHVPGTKDDAPAKKRRHIVEFSGETVQYATQFMKDVRASLRADRGVVTLLFMEHNQENGSIRVVFDAEPSGLDAMDIRLYLSLKDKPITEIWTRSQYGTG